MLSWSIYKTRTVTTRSSIQSQFSGVHISRLLHSIFNFSRSHPIWFIHGSIYNLGRFLFLSTYQRKNNNNNINNQTKSKQNRRKCPDVPFRPGQRDHSSRVCCSHQSHFGIKVALCASTNLLLLTFCDPS